MRRVAEAFGGVPELARRAKLALQDALSHAIASRKSGVEEPDRASQSDGHAHRGRADRGGAKRPRRPKSGHVAARTAKATVRRARARSRLSQEQALKVALDEVRAARRKP